MHLMATVLKARHNNQCQRLKKNKSTKKKKGAGPTTTRAELEVGRNVVYVAATLLILLVVFGTTSIPSASALPNWYRAVGIEGLNYTPVLYHTFEYPQFEGISTENLDTRNVNARLQAVSIGGIDYRRSLVPPFAITGVQVLAFGFWRPCKFREGDLDVHLAYHISANLGSSILVHGGVTVDGVSDRFATSSEVYRLRIRTDAHLRDYFCIWEPDDAPNPPSPRFAHTVVPHPGKKDFFVFGGCTTPGPRLREERFLTFTSCDAVLSDLHHFSVEANAWREIPLSSSAPRLSFHVSAYLASKGLLYMFSGYTSLTTRNKDMWVVQLPDTITDTAVAPATLTPTTVANYTHISRRSRGAVDTENHDFALYFVTPNPGPFAEGRRLLPFRGDFSDDLSTFTWRKMERVSTFHNPGSSIELTNSFPLGGGISYRRSPTGDGLLTGVLINTGLGVGAPHWEVSLTSNRLGISLNGVPFRRRPGGRSFARISQLDDTTFLMTGGLNSGPRSSSFLFSVESNTTDVITPTTAADFDPPPLRITPNPPNTLVARAGHCSIPIDAQTTLIAGGTTDFVVSSTLDDVIFHSQNSSVQVVGETPFGSPSYASLKLQGCQCFRTASNVYAVGGSAVQGFNDAFVPTHEDIGFLRIWEPVTGWKKCNLFLDFPISLTYGTAQLLQVPPRADADPTEPLEEVIAYFGGYDPVALPPVVQGDLHLIRCNGAPLSTCSCDQITVTRYAFPSDQSITWPPKRISSCSTTLGPHRLFLNGGHFDGRPEAVPYMMSLQSDLSVRWTRISFLGNRIEHPLRAYGEACFRWNRHIYTVGGTSLGRILDQIFSIAPACNQGSGVASKSDFLSSTCTTCAIHEYRSGLSRDSCKSCPVGTRRPQLSLGVDSRECIECIPGYCLHSTPCFVNVDFEAQCQCGTWFKGTRCESLNQEVVTRVVAVPLALIAAALIGLATYRYYVRLRKREFLHKQLVDETAAELQELHSSWEISQADVHFIRRIGTGGFGDVWLATWLVIDRNVAVKKLQPGLLQSDYAAFLEEIKLMKSIKHRNIVFFHGACIEADEPFLVMEYVSRGSVADIMHDPSISIHPARRISFMKDAASGMAYLHGLSPPRIHRDLKSHNLLVTDNWVVKVADFTTAKKVRHLDPAASIADKEAESIARSANQGDDAAVAVFVNPTFDKTSTLGTLHWAAPEILLGQTYTLAVDVYSFGIVMWEVLTRCHPFPDMQFFTQLREAVANQDKRPPIAPNDEKQFPAYVSLMRDCWDKSPGNRPSFSAVLLRLDSCLTSPTLLSLDGQTDEARL